MIQLGQIIRAKNPKSRVDVTTVLALSDVKGTSIPRMVFRSGGLSKYFLSLSFSRDPTLVQLELGSLESTQDARRAAAVLPVPGERRERIVQSQLRRRRLSLSAGQILRQKLRHG